MRILISGSTGLIGTALVDFLKASGHQVNQLVREKDDLRSETIWWDPQFDYINLPALENFDAVIHLAGKNIAEKRWNECVKTEILESRVKGTKILAHALACLHRPPPVFICASAMGFYGNCGELECTEDSPRGNTFLAEVCEQWERATEPAKKAGIRTVNLRFGVVLTPRGGTLAKMLKPFEYGLGGKMGSGEQFMSWIALDDLLSIILYIMTDKQLSGPVNVVSPFPVTNLEFTKTLGRVLKRPTFFSLPAFILRFILGQEMANELLLSSTRVKPAKLLDLGFGFAYPRLEDALKHLLG